MDADAPGCGWDDWAASNNDWWRMVMLKALAQYEEETGDPRVIPVLSRYFAHQLEALPNRPLRDWGKFRWQDNALAVIWLYNRKGESKLVDLERLLHKQGFDWQAEFADFKHMQAVTPEMIKLNENNGLSDYALSMHGVNHGQALKAAPVWSVISGSEADRRGLAQMQPALDKYHGLPTGMFSCDEHFAGRNPLQGWELCTVAEAMFSLEQSLAILGDAAIGDRLERIAFNALPGTFSDDMWAHQYNQEPNQVEVSLHRKPKLARRSPQRHRRPVQRKRRSAHRMLLRRQRARRISDDQTVVPLRRRKHLPVRRHAAPPQLHPVLRDRLRKDQRPSLRITAFPQVKS